MSSDSSTETDGYRWGSLESFNGKVFITAAIIFFLVLAGYLALQCLNRYVFAGHAMDGLLRQLGSVQLQPANHPPDQLPISTTRTGLHPSIIAVLPVVAYQKGKKNDSNTYGDGPVECAVCLGQLEEGEKVRTLPRCLHLFHVGCIDMWLFSHLTCPVCRANAKPPDDPLGFPVSQVIAMARLATAKEVGSTSRQHSSIDAGQDLERSQC